MMCFGDAQSIEKSRRSHLVPSSTSTHCHIAKTYCEALQLTREGLDNIKEKNPRAATRFIKIILAEWNRKQRLESIRKKIAVGHCDPGSQEWAARYIQAFWERYARRWLADGVSLGSSGLTPSDRRREQIAPGVKVKVLQLTTVR